MSSRSGGALTEMETLTFDLSELPSTFGIPETSIQMRAEDPTIKTATQHQDRGEEQDGHNEIDEEVSAARSYQSISLQGCWNIVSELS